MSSGNEVEQDSFDSAATQKWRFTCLGDNVYTIRSENNLITPYYLGLKNNGTTEETAIVLRTGAVTSGMKWRIEEGVQGYKIVSYSNSAMVLRTLTSNSNPGEKLVLGKFYSNTNYRDEWNIWNTDASFNNIALMALNENQVARNAYFAPVRALVDQYFDVDVYESFYSSCSEDTMRNIMSTYDMIVVHTHGKKTGFYISSSNPLSMSEIANSDLSNLKFALLLTCNTGKDYNSLHITNHNPQNIIEQMVICGAGTIVGFNDITNVTECNQLAEDLMRLLIVDGCSIEVAIEKIDFNADGYHRDMSGLIEIAGNSDYKVR